MELPARDRTRGLTVRDDSPPLPAVSTRCVRRASVRAGEMGVSMGAVERAGISFSITLVGFGRDKPPLLRFLRFSLAEELG